MPAIKTVKILFYFAAILLFAKPFLGFNVFGHINSAIQTNIYVKVFSKRKLETNPNNDLTAIQKKLAMPLTAFLLRFSFLITLLFPAVLKLDEKTTSRFLHRLQLNLLPRKLALLTGQLII